MTLYIIELMSGEFLDRHQAWVKAPNADALFQTPHKDVALNQLIELNAKDINLRARVITCDTDDRGQPEQALAVLGPLGTSPRRPIEFQGASLLGAAFEQEGRLEDAEETYLDISERSELDFQIRDALASAARIRALQGDGEGAIELYERVLETLEAAAPERGLYEMRIEEIRAIS